jgi:Zn-dependent protease
VDPGSAKPAIGVPIGAGVDCVTPIPGIAASRWRNRGLWVHGCEPLGVGQVNDRATPPVARYHTRDPDPPGSEARVDQIVLNLIMIAIFLGIAFPVHEFAHAWVAYLRGDATAKLFGRLTLNPIVHFDPFGGLMTVVSIFLGGFLFGWAKPTPVNTSNLRNRQNDEVLVAIAGPASNLLMALAGAVAFRILDATVGLSGLLATGLYLFVVFNAMLAIFNMIPVPPLDGGTLLFRFLSPRQAWQVRPFLTQYGMFIVIAIVLLGGRFLSGLINGVALFLLGIG